MAEIQSRFDTESLRLEQIRYGGKRLIDNHQIKYAADMSAYQHEAMDALVLEVNALVWAEKLLEREMIVPYAAMAWRDFPASPWQFFKQRHADTRWLGWLVRRRPVRHEAHRFWIEGSRRIRLEQFAVFPECDIRMPEKYHHGRYVRYERSSVSPV